MRGFRGPVLSVGVVVAAACGTPNGGPEDPGPDMVFVLLDDVRPGDLFEHPIAPLPSIERLATEGAVFENAFTVAPLCSPSRAAFLTGQYPSRNGIVDNRERAEQSHRIRTFPRLLREAGYLTAFVGKWHMGHEDATPRPGFDHWVSFVGQGSYVDPEFNINGRQAFESGYTTDVLTRYAVEFIRGAPEDRPFALVLAHKAVHPEIHPGRERTFPAAAEDDALELSGDLPRPPSWRASLDGKPALARTTEYDDPRSPPGGTPDEVIEGRLKMLPAVDRGLADVLDALDARGRMDNTVLVLSSDQGFFYGEFGLAQERRLAYEPSIRIPFVIRYPPLTEPGSRPTELVTNLDLAPTLLELGNVIPPADIDGASLVPVLDGFAPRWRTGFMIEYASDEVFERIVRMGYKAFRTDRYKYIRYEELDGMDELYDLSEDPHELVNIIARAEAGLLERLDAELNATLAAATR